MTRIFTFLFATIVAGVASAKGCFPFCDTGQWKTAHCEILCTGDFWLNATAEDLQEVLLNGEPIDARDGNGWGPIHYAVIFGNPDTVEALLEAGADPTPDPGPDPDHARDLHNGTVDVYTPLEFAFKSSPSFATGSDFGSGLRYLRITDSENAFIERTSQQNTEIIEMLISAGARINTNSRISQMLVLSSVSMEYMDILRQLLEAGADVNAAGFVAPPLHSARSLKTFELLVNAGAALDAKGPHGYTALHYAIYNKNVPLTLALIELGAKVDIATARGETALHLLVRAPKRDYKRQTIAEYAASETEIAKLLLEHGAQIDVESNAGVSPMEALYLAGRGSSDLAKLFVEWGAEEIPPTQRICTQRTRKGIELIEVAVPCPTE